jgi:lipid II:glycine glycyltransferase (peptidoglycan interpeptide bridge formation enzyme)
LKISLFHEDWWLSAATKNQFEEAITRRGNEVVGRLPFVATKRGPFRVLRMPPFTHTLGPAIEAGDGKPQTRLVRRLSLVRSLIDQLPPFSYFHQHLDPSLDDGLALADGLGFQEREFTVSPQYTFEIDCRRSLEELWNAMYLKTRQHVRRAEKEYLVRSVDDPKLFIRFYENNIKASKRKNTLDFANFPSLFSECRTRECGAVLGAFDHSDTPIAMTYLVWGHGTMYYLLSTRSFHAHDYGAMSFLIWTAMKRAHELALVLDLDGVYSSGTVRFLTNFGGQIKTRLAIRRSQMSFRAVQLLKHYYSEDETHFFT